MTATTTDDDPPSPFGLRRDKGDVDHTSTPAERDRRSRQPKALDDGEDSR